MNVKSFYCKNELSDNELSPPSGFKGGKQHERTLTSVDHQRLQQHSHVLSQT